MNDIALVNCCLPTQEKRFLGPPQSILSIASYLAVHGFKAKLFDPQLEILPSEFTPTNLFNYLNKIPYDIIGLSIWDSVLPKVILAVEMLKSKYPQKIIILGGPSASTLQDEIISNFPWIDFVIKGEGERPLKNLLKWLSDKEKDVHNLSNNISGRLNGKIIYGQNKIARAKLSELPINNYNIIKYDLYNKAEIITTRGCPFNCSFCSVNSSWGNKLNYFSLDNIFKEIECLIYEHHYDLINILDDNFGINKIRLRKFCKVFSSKYPDKEWSCYFRLADMDENTVELMSSSGCQGLYVGIETGDDILLGKIKKGFSSNEVIEKVKFASKHLNIIASFIWGFPYESYTQTINTLNLINEILDNNNVIVNLFQLSPLSGTQILNDFKSNLAFDEEYISGFIYPPILAKLSVEEKELIKKYPLIFSAFYHEHSKEFYRKHAAINKFLAN